jgi:hypothetical protein
MLDEPPNPVKRAVAKKTKDGETAWNIPKRGIGGVN